jgi:hypothetical protein
MQIASAAMIYASTTIEFNLELEIMRFILTCVLSLAAIAQGVLAQVIPVAFEGQVAAANLEPTLTFLWPGSSPKATLIYIPGGEGRLGLTPERKNLGGFYGATLKPLSDSNLSSGSLHVVVFDSPAPLPVGANYPISRTNTEHLARIESVVRYYKSKYGLPVWLMGHSNGAASLTEFYASLQRENKTDLLAGAIYSSARNGARFDSKTQLPILFLAHEKDACAKSTNYNSRKVFEEQRSTNTQRLNYVLIRGGEGQAQDVCSSGFHMFYGAGAEAYQAIEAFILAP